MQRIELAEDPEIWQFISPRAAYDFRSVRIKIARKIGSDSLSGAHVVWHTTCLNTKTGWNGLNWRITYANVDNKKHVGTFPDRSAFVVLG